MQGASQFVEALLFTLIAGLATGIGGAFIFFAKSLDRRILSFSLGLSAGVMIYVSMIELFPEAAKQLSMTYGDKTGTLYTALAFFCGILLIGVIDRLIPCDENPHEIVCSVEKGQRGRKTLKHTGLLTALAIAIHNFPEGMAVFVAANQSLRLAIPIVVAIAIHNIPEGISVAMPIYYSTGSRRIAMRYATLAGLAEPLGALVGYFILMPFMTRELNSLLFAFVAGIMVFISLDELLPSAEIYGEHHMGMYGLILGMGLMALSLWLFM